jgi:tellurite resistance protein TehA-like permease
LSEFQWWGGKQSGDRRLSSLRTLRLGAAWIGHAAAALNPAYFAFVMATGIVSNALFLHGEHGLSDALFALNVIAYLWLWLLTALRAVRSCAAIAADLTSPRRLFLFFTTVAATNVLAMSVAQRGFTVAAVGMWLVALVLWLALIYLAFGVPMLSHRARDADVIDGAWLDAVVGTQSLVVAGGAVALPAIHAVQAYIALPMLWALGFILYGILVTLLCHRLIHSALRPDDVTPPLWLVMGAAAISANAGAVLIVHGAVTPFLSSLVPFLSGGMLGGWAWATWWIPLLLLLEIWKHGAHRIAIGYTPMLWTIVFPLGMYAVATFRLAGIAAVPVLQSWSLVFAWAAFAAWCATAAGMLSASMRSARMLIGLAHVMAGPTAGHHAAGRRG